MSARILIVDDVAFNLKLLENKLKMAYYDVFTAATGHEAIRKVQEIKPDLILMDIMMPDIDGIETTKRIKAQAEFSHIPVVMITALNSQEDKINTLIAGADDFLTKPINERTLMIRVRSLLRIKFAADELRLREETTAQLGLSPKIDGSLSVMGSEVMVVDDNLQQSEKIKNKLIENGIHVNSISEPDKALNQAIQHKNYSMIIVSTQLLGYDGLRLCSQIKSNESLRNIPIMILVDEDDDITVERGLDMGIQDYILTPVEPNELIARVYNHIIRKQHHDRMRQNYLNNVSLSLLDPLTNIHNRRYLDTHLDKLITQSIQHDKNLTILMVDLDNFKQINDEKGHAAGDSVLKEVAHRLTANLRTADLCIRYGGDEFIIILPNTDLSGGHIIAERILHAFRERPFVINNSETVECFCSIGIAQAQPGHGINDLIKQADTNLYQAKNLGRNQSFYSPTSHGESSS